MSTIAQDYAAELRRIAGIVKYGLSAADVSELKLSARYLETCGDGKPVKAEDVALVLGVSETIFFRMMKETSASSAMEQAFGFDRSAAIDIGFVTAVFDACLISHVMHAVSYAVRSDRPGSPLCEADFIATAREVYRWASEFRQELDARANEPGGRA